MIDQYAIKDLKFLVKLFNKDIEAPRHDILLAVRYDDSTFVAGFFEKNMTIVRAR